MCERYKIENSMKKENLEMSRKYGSFSNPLPERLNSVDPKSRLIDLKLVL